ncbi:PP2C family protein-serine/threonine phosphatase [Clostridium lundense]|uniref:PP2C family protein-serine/threonine phosphatase n=1 Tax=Clostridium lundense TaxID=319475 RepID=UPI0004846B17|nr:protein phosphatase 2C domain-containing protein [Clostridium lundense]
MTDLIKSNYYTLLGVLIFLLVSLIILKKFLLIKYKKENVKIETASTIGGEEAQEDNFKVVTSEIGTIAVLADGLGKNKGGKISSKVAVSTFIDIFLSHRTLGKVEYFFNKAFNASNREILKRIDSKQGGTSLVSAVIMEGFLYYAMVGDTVIAILRENELLKLSEGHTLDVLAKQEFYKGRLSKEIALSAINERKLLYYLGMEEFKSFEIFDIPIKLKKQDIIVLMNRGIYETLTWNEIENTIIKNSNFNGIGKKIIDKVKDTEKEDKHNGTIMLMKYI